MTTERGQRDYRFLKYRSGRLSTSALAIRPGQLRRAWIWILRQRTGLLTWAALPTVLLTVVVMRYAHTYFFYDEWSMIGRVALERTGLHPAFASFNGHLWVLNYVVYLVQVRMFGIENHFVVYAVFCSSLLALHLSLAAVLRALELPSLVAILGAGLVVYFGPGAQTMVFEIELGPNFATALSFTAALIVLRAAPSRRSVLGASVALVAAMGCDSGLATVGLFFVAVLIVGRWRSRLGLATLVPPALVGIAWLATGARSGPQKAAGLRQQLDFAIKLVLRGVGGLAGSGELVGAMVLGAAAVALVVALRQHALHGAPLLAFAAGTATVVAASVWLARSRAGIVGNDLTDYNRYIQLVGMYALIALLPSLYRCLAPRKGRFERAAPVTASVLLLAALLSNTTSLFDYRNTFEQWNSRTRGLVVQSDTVLGSGCGRGRTPNPDARPLGTLDPQITVGLLETLRQRGWVDLPSARRVEAFIRDAICPPPLSD
jgi:hypothetical protein